MKVLHICIERSWGGGEKQAMQLVNGLMIRGIKVSVFCSADSSVHDFCRNQGIEHLSRSISSVYDTGSILALIRYIKSSSPDIIHLHSSKAHSIGLMASAFVQSVPLILTRRMDVAVKSNAISNWKYNHRRIKKIICVSNAVKKCLTPAIKEPSKLTTIYGGIDLQETQKRIQPDFFTAQFADLKGCKTIGFIGSLATIKNPTLFVQMAHKLKQSMPTVRFVIIGEGGLMSDLKSLITRLKLSDHVKLMGFVKKNIEALSALQLLVVTSKSEGLPNVILEAAALKIPVVSTNVGGVSEFVENEVTGLLSPENNLEELTKNCEKLLNDPAMAREMTNRAFEKVKNFSNHKGIDQTLSVYQEVLNQGFK